MSKISTVTAMTATTVLKSRLGWAATAFGLILGGLVRLFAAMSLGQDQRLTSDLTIAGVITTGIILAIIITASFVLAEQDRGVLLMIRSKPVSAGQLIGGKLLGLWLAVSLLYWEIACLAVLAAGWGSPLPWKEIGLTLFVGWLELSVVIAVGTLFAALSGPTLAIFYTVGLWVGGRSFALINDAAIRAGGTVASFVRHLGYLIPNFSRFNLHETYLTAGQLSTSFYVDLTLYAVVWVVICGLLASLIFEQREW